MDNTRTVTVAQKQEKKGNRKRKIYEIYGKTTETPGIFAIAETCAGDGTGQNVLSS